jgi:hypothetical protein
VLKKNSVEGQVPVTGKRVKEAKDTPLRPLLCAPEYVAYSGRFHVRSKDTSTEVKDHLRKK